MTFTPPASPVRGTETLRTAASGPPPYSLLSVASDIVNTPGLALAEDGIPRTGIRRDHKRCIQSVTLENCVDTAITPSPEDDIGTPSAEDLAGADPGFEFYPFTWSVPVGCDATHPNYERLAELATEDVVAASAWNVSAQLWSGAANEGSATDSPSLRTVGVAPEGDTAIAAHLGLGVLLDAYYSCTQGGAGATLHIPNLLLPQYRRSGEIGPVGAQLVGPGGELVSRGPGYDREMGPTGRTDAGDLEAWVYISGPINVRLGTVLDPANPRNVGGRPEGVSNPRRNENSVIRNRRAILSFDTCCVFAVKVAVPEEA